MQFKYLVSPVNIGTVTVRNRIVFPPIDVALHDPERAVHPGYIDFICSLVKDNGVGLVISEFTSVADGSFWAPASKFDSDELIPEFKKFVKRVKSFGARFFMQLALIGGRAPEGRIVAPSAIESPLYPVVPEELTGKEIKELIEKWIEAAVRAKKTGFDGVEVHGGHSYLIGEFMSPHSNQRDDEYGYDFNGRMRFPSEIVKGIKEACGSDFPVGFKFSAFEALENGITGPLSVDIARRLEKTGVDYLHVSSSTYMLGGTNYPDVPPMYVPEGPLVQFAAQIKKGVSVPVITVAGIVSPEFAEDIIARGKADLVAVGRAMFADTGWASKVVSGKAQEIRPCIRCNVCHKKMIIDRAGSAECTVNPGLLHDPVETVRKPLKVVVVGAGPAGLEAAIRASERGHEVSLYERGDTIGGNINIGAIPPFKRDLARLLDYYKQQLKNSSVQFFPGQEVSAKQIIEKKADIIIVAVGASEIIPKISGIDNESVFNVRDILKNGKLRYLKGDRVAVIGAGSVGCELAWHLSLTGKKVFLLDILKYEEWLPDEHPTNRFVLLEKLEETGVTIIDSAQILEIGESPSIKAQRKNVEYTLYIDYIIVAAGFRQQDHLSKELHALSDTEESPRIYEIGDCVNVRDIHWAVREGYEVGTTI